MQIHAWHLLGVEQNRSCTLTYVCLSIQPAILLPAADVTVAADDNLLPPNLTGATNVQLDLNRVKTPGMETYWCPVDIKRQSLDGKREVKHNSADTDWIHDGQQRTGQILLVEPRCCNALQCEGHQWRWSRCEMKKEHATPHNYRPISLFSGSKTHQFSYCSPLHSMIWCILNWKYYEKLAKTF